VEPAPWSTMLAMLAVYGLGVGFALFALAFSAALPGT
jgi:hypothetical protein